MSISSHTAKDDPADEAHDDPDVADASETREVSVPVQQHASRLDRALADLVPEFSRSYLQQLIDSDAVMVNGVCTAKSSAKVKAGDVLTVELRPTPQSLAFKPEAMKIDVVFEDEFLLVLNKPAGLVVHPAPGNWSGTLLNGLLARDPQAGLLPRAGIVHRLDKDTSGLMVVARKRLVMDKLVQMIAARTVSRNYLALAHGVWKGPTTQQVDLPIGRDPRNRLRMAVVDLEKSGGKSAMTDFTHLVSSARHCLVQCRLHTGRTHQIRVHLASLNHCLVADELYGGKADAGLKRQALHAWRLAFEHPVTAQPLQFDSALPADILQALGQVGLIYTGLPKDSAHFSTPS